MSNSIKSSKSITLKGIVAVVLPSFKPQGNLRLFNIIIINNIYHLTKNEIAYGMEYT